MRSYLPDDINNSEHNIDKPFLSEICWQWTIACVPTTSYVVCSFNYFDIFLCDNNQFSIKSHVLGVKYTHLGEAILIDTQNILF